MGVGIIEETNLSKSNQIHIRWRRS